MTSTPEATADAGDDTPSIGAYLAQQRKLRGMSLEDLAELTRIPMRSLERLEGGSFDRDVDGFVRGFVRTVASALGLDLDDTLARMLREPDPGAGPAVGARLSIKRVIALAAALAVLVALVGLVRVAVRSGAGVDPTTEIVHRRDPVRALAEAAGASDELAPVAAPPLRPTADGDAP